MSDLGVAATSDSSSLPSLDLAFSRRAILSVAGLAGVALVASACSSGGGAATPSKSAGSTPAATTLGATSSIPVGGGVVFPNNAVVVTQPKAGTFEGFSAICPHQGCTVVGVIQGVIVCPCHSSTFDITTGAVLGGPAPTGLTPAKVKVEGSNVVLLG